MKHKGKDKEDVLCIFQNVNTVHINPIRTGSWSVFGQLIYLILITKVLLPSAITQKHTENGL